MPSPAVTYSFTNSTTADASQVNQNFTDVINGITDGTKDLSISALTCAGNVNLNANTTLGNGSSDTITFTGSQASHLNPSAHNTYDFGTATSLGYRYLYLASSSATFTARLGGPAISANINLTLPAVTGTLDVVKDKPYELTNLGVSTSVGSNALTIALKGKDGNDPSASNPVYIGFRSSTVTSGVYTQRSVTGALSVVVSSGSTLGHASAIDHYIYVYAIDNAGTVELAVSTTYYDSGSVISTTAEGGAGASDSNRVIYSTTARTNVPCRVIARLKSQQATAGTWATSIAEVSLWPFAVQKIFAHYSTNAGQSWGAGPGTIAVVDYEDKVLDTHNCVTTGAAWKFTAPKALTYYGKASALWINNPVPADTAMTMNLRKNGTDLLVLNQYRVQTATSASQHLLGSFEVSLAAGDYIDITLTNNDDSGQSMGGDGTYSYIQVSADPETI